MSKIDEPDSSKNFESSDYISDFQSSPKNYKGFNTVGRKRAIIAVVIILIVFLCAGFFILKGLKTWKYDDNDHWHQLVFKISYSAHEESVTSEVSSTCTEDGTKSLKCDICGFEHNEIIPATGHKDLLVASLSPTCVIDGYNTFRCSVCGNVHTDVAKATGHIPDPDGMSIKTDPKCDEDGSIMRVCKTCGKFYTEILPATGHDFDNGVVKKNPTSNSEGIKEYTCKTCGYTKTETFR